MKAHFELLEGVVELVPTLKAALVVSYSCFLLPARTSGAHAPVFSSARSERSICLGIAFGFG